ncbi:hypothetical protein AZF37_00310 [endosymbiont 'TC1' of Trimyema compressum]|uniref:hypothetical protein n=1 Tax=endosymbiont 'TC1' of Trimyema compressum TaxID=243899 RepID=UPI0007F14441|nr:hypothetical protein [endosymbiont 'TC1' of Trimyema compressum]AMP19825.1 hypothetical protein AZF37_00310 [endosymbiont 'TC1' of Trimyema compressum]
MHYKEEDFIPLLYKIGTLLLTYINIVLLGPEINNFYLLASVIGAIPFLLINEKGEWILLLILIPQLYLPLFPILLSSFRKYWPILTLYAIILINTNLIQIAVVIVLLLILYIEQVRQKLINEQKISRGSSAIQSAS